MTAELTAEENINSKICRVCLKTSEDKSLSLFENYKNNLIYTYIHILTDVKIYENDGYPDRICKDCLLELDTAIKFKEKCEESNNVLRGVACSLITVEAEPPLDIKIEENLTENAQVKLEFTEEHSSDTEYDGTELVASETNCCQGDTKILGSPLQCHDCGDYFKSKCKLRVHWKKTHLAQSRIRVCVRCKLSFKSLHAYQNHLKNVTKRCKALGDELIKIEGQGKNRIFHCKECNYNTTYLPNIIHHCAKHSGKRQYECDVCRKGFIQYASWSKHMEYTHKQFKQILTCQYCGKVLKGSDTIRRHLKIHTEQPKFQCDICKKMYKTKCTLQNHMNLHKEKNYTCEICAKVFHTPSGLWIHIQYVHKRHNRKLFKCSICEYKTLRLYNVRKHERKHTDNNIACPQCGKFFDKADKMLKHQRIHFEEKKFECTLCDRKYLSLDSLHKHQKFAHNMLFS